MAEQEAKLNMAMNAGNVTAWIYELHTQEFMLRGNMRTEKGLNMEKYLGMLHPDDRIIQKELFDTILHGQKESAETVFRYMHEDGTYHYYDSRMISKKEEDTVTAILGTQKDITQEILNNKILNDTIEKLRFAIQTAGMAMWEYNCDTQLFTTYNEPVADYKDGAVISMSTYDCYSQKDDENLELIEKAAGIVKDRKDESYNFIVKMKTKYDSDWQYCTVRGVPMEKDKNGTGDRNRPLQGLAPYTVNAGLAYQGSIFGAAVNYGRNGRKLLFAGLYEKYDQYEASRDVLDLQISARLLKSRMEIKFNASDLLNQDIIVYQNCSPSKTDRDPANDKAYVDLTSDMNYNSGDWVLSRIKKGVNLSLSVSYKF